MKDLKFIVRSPSPSFPQESFNSWYLNLISGLNVHVVLVWWAKNDPLKKVQRRVGVGVQGLYLRNFCSLSNSTDVGIKLFVLSICGQRAGFLGSAAGCGRGEATWASLFSLLLTGFLRHASKRNCKVDSCICSWALSFNGRTEEIRFDGVAGHGWSSSWGRRKKLQVHL